MPLGFERLNERVKRPNAQINFIKPLERGNRDDRAHAHAQDYLERIAAIVYPLMKKHHLLVMALEEFPHNTEFAGRNFNAGEVIQLVLRAPGPRRGELGPFLPFRHVQMVMVHELAHCKEMNHGRGFWKWRNQLADELKELWGKGYTGEGFWSRGRTTLSGEYEDQKMPEGILEPQHLCGGTFRTGRGKRKRGRKEKEQLSYAERQQRRIRRKFGTGGVTVGADDETKSTLEGGKKTKGKPRVAGSARGRELRAAAALARFEKAKQDEIKKEEVLSGSETESETESEYESDTGNQAIDVDGKKMFDSKGHSMVKVCEDEDQNDPNAKREMDELRDMDIRQWFMPEISSQSESRAEEPPPNELNGLPRTRDSMSPETKIKSEPEAEDATIKEPPQSHAPPPANNSLTLPSVCSACSLENEAGSVICLACSNVLDPKKTLNHWRCQSLTCRETHFVNSGDAGICGLCGASRSSSATGQD